MPKYTKAQQKKRKQIMGAKGALRQNFEAAKAPKKNQGKLAVKRVGEYKKAKKTR